MLQRDTLTAQARASGRVRATAPDLQSLFEGLHAVGCELPGRAWHKGHNVCGVSIALAVRKLLQSPQAFDDLVNLVRQYAASDMGLTLTLHDLGAGDASIQAFETLCYRLYSAGVPKHPRLGLCVRASTLPLRAYALITQCWLGSGPRYVLMEPPQMQNAAAPAIDDSWEYLWRRRGSRWAVLPAYGESVSTPCPLLDDEAASAVLPAFGIQAPVGSAWLPLRLHLPRFANKQGDINAAALERALLACIDSGEQLHDLLCWPLPDMQRDAWQNRRIAVIVSGFGDLVTLRQQDPSNLDALQSLLGLVDHIRTTLWSRSAQLARTTDLLPSIASHEPSFEASDEQQQRRWAERWQGAIEQSAVRHRNLLVMSPYSVLPQAGDGCAAFADLLPVIGFADAHSFADPASFRGWKFRDFRHFHRRAWAVIQRRNGASVVATRA